MEKLNLMIVDDELVIQELCSEILSKEGYDVVTAGNGMEAQKQLHKLHIDIVFVDLKMPLMGGLELLEIIKRDFPYAEVIIMTAYATIENAVEAMKKGAYDIILKPFNPDQIRLVAKRCFEKIAMGRENKELQKANKKLRELQEMKDKFIAITSHELRTPVSHIKGYLNIITDDLLTNQITINEKHEYLKIIESSVNNLEQIVMNMHEIIGVNNGSLALAREELDLNQLIKQLAGEFSLAFQERKQKVSIDASDSSMLVYGDLLRVKQMTSELIRNAIKYTPDGGVIKLETTSDNEHRFIHVSDSGIGIPAEEQGKIFEKFYEVQNSDYHSSGKIKFMSCGIGLGLSIAKAIAEAHGGGIKVVSDVNKGTRFTVYLPV